jgi:hypothetical protein
MVNNNFDFGTEHEIKEPGVAFKNPELGEHSARLRSLIHCGLFRETFNKEKKKPFPEVVAVFELKEDGDFEEDGVTPLTISKPFPLKKGDRAFMTKFIKALDPKGEAKGFDDLIGAACTVNCVGSKVKNEDGTPKYVNFGGISGLPSKFAKMMEPLQVEGVGHVPFDKLTKDAILELNPIREVNMILMEGENYSGSKAEEIINEIRAENPEFAKRKAKTNSEGDSTSENKTAEKPVEKETNLTDEEEF